MRLKKHFVRATSFAMAVAMMFGMSLPAFAERYNLNVGSVTVSGSADGSRYVKQENNSVADGTKAETTETVIYQADPTNDEYTDTPTTSQPETATQNTVTINAIDGDVDVTLENLNIDVRETKDGEESKAAITVNTNTGKTATIELDGQNTVQSGSNHAGLEKGSYTEMDSRQIKANMGKLVIQDENKHDTTDNSGNTTTDSLTAVGGDYAAGIGGAACMNSRGENMVSCDNITITGGTINATGGSDGAGIGGAYQGIGQDITISGGTVNATGGNNGYADNITISGGTVTAAGGEYGAGIGGGANPYGFAAGITISGGTVTATGGEKAAGIGSGWTGQYSADITITGGTVTAAGGTNGTDYGADIGGGYGGYLTDSVRIGQNANITLAQSKTIGNGSNSNETEASYTVHSGAKINGKEITTANATDYLNNASGAINIHDTNNTSTADGTTASGDTVNALTCSDEGTTWDKYTVHEVGSSYESDAYSHWQVCENCGVIENKAAHSFEKKETVTATCQHDSYEIWECVCGAAEERNHSNTLGEHTPEDDDGNCTTAIACSVCGEETTPAKSHSFTNKASFELVSGADCEHAAVYKVKCDNDGCNVLSDTVTVEVDSALGHDYTNAEVTYTWTQDKTSGAWTCTATRTCTRNGCGHGDTATLTGIAEIEAEHVNATCMTTGSKTYKATFKEDWANDPKTQQADIDINENAHKYSTETAAFSWQDSEDGAEPTATAERECTLNSEHKTDVAASVVVEEVTNKRKEPTCTDSGKAYYIAKATFKYANEEAVVITSKEHEVTLAPLDHAWSEWVEKTPATCGANKVEERHCIRAGCTAEPETREIAGTATGEHTWELTETIEKAACDKNGKGSYTCTVCGKTKTDAIAKLSETGEHSWDGGEITTAATTEAEGVKTYTCTACGATKTETIEKLPPAPDPTPVTPEQGGNEGGTTGGETEPPATPGHGGTEQTTPATPAPTPVQPTEKPATPPLPQQRSRSSKSKPRFLSKMSPLSASTPPPTRARASRAPTPPR